MNKDWIGNKKSTFVTLGATSHTDRPRQASDYYATDPTAIDDIFKVENFSDTIWEPACGEGHLSKQMEKWNKSVYSTDLINRGYGHDFFDFLSSFIVWNGDIITNPPYKLAKEFVEHGLKRIKKTNKLGFFLKLTFLESKNRQRLFEENPPIRIWVYSLRKSVAINGDKEMFEKSSAACYAWFVWEKGYKGYPEIHWIK
jgi:hypothetical protein